MMHDAIAGMLVSLKDEGHTIYLDPEDAKHEQEALEGKLEGIGAIVTVRDHLPTILVTMPNSPARKAGLKPNDILLKVDDKSITQEPLQKVVGQIRGPAGKNVTLTIQRDGQTEPMTMTLTRRSSGRRRGVAHAAGRAVRPRRFAVVRPARRRAAARRSGGGPAAGCQGGDFRPARNPGGYKDQAVKVTSEFLKDGNVFIEQDMHGKRSNVPVEPGGTATDVPLVVLIDGGSASAAEICAGEQDHKRAKLVGQKTFGTGTVLQPFELSDGSELHLATLEWLTPNGQVIWHEGIKPDFLVALPEGGMLCCRTWRTTSRRRPSRKPATPSCSRRSTFSANRCRGSNLASRGRKPPDGGFSDCTFHPGAYAPGSPGLTPRPAGRRGTPEPLPAAGRGPPACGCIHTPPARRPLPWPDPPPKKRGWGSAQ